MVGVKLKKEELREKVTDASCGLIATVVDFALHSIVLMQPRVATSFKAYLIENQKAIDNLVAMGIDRELVKKTLHKLVYRKYLKRGKDHTLEISEEGWRKVNNMFPVYKAKRDWDGKLYLITYDVPEKLRAKRNLMRAFIKTIGGGKLQESVWLCVYDPKPALRRFVRDNELQGMIIVSDIGKEGAIGDEDLDDLVMRVFKLDNLNDDYQNLIHEMKDGTLIGRDAYYKYLSILSRDPQLPFGILPYDWKGDQAYRMVVEYCSNQNAAA